MELLKLSVGMNQDNIVVRPLSSSTQDDFRARANQIASTVLGTGQQVSMTSLYCDEENLGSEENISPAVRREVPEAELALLELNARNYKTSNAIDTLKGLMTFVDPKIEAIDFSIGYVEGERFQANLREMESLFRTVVTVYDKFYEKIEDFNSDRYDATAFRAWFDAAMGNLVCRLLREVANNNQVARRGQLIANPERSPLRDYICDRIGALDEESNPTGWKEAAHFELEKFFALEERHSLDRKESTICDILSKALHLLKHYS